MSSTASNPLTAKSPLSEAHEPVSKSNTLSLWFSRFAGTAAYLVGHPSMFLSAAAIVIAWAVIGPFFHYSDTWQLVINTGSSVVTFLVVFLIQNTQNRDAKALHLKLDELIRSHTAADNDLIDIENYLTRRWANSPCDMRLSGKSARRAKLPRTGKSAP